MLFSPCSHWSRVLSIVHLTTGRNSEFIKSPRLGWFCSRSWWLLELKNSSTNFICQRSDVSDISLLPSLLTALQREEQKSTWWKSEDPLLPRICTLGCFFNMVMRSRKGSEELALCVMQSAPQKSPLVGLGNGYSVQNEHEQPSDKNGDGKWSSFLAQRLWEMETQQVFSRSPLGNPSWYKDLSVIRSGIPGVRRQNLCYWQYCSWDPSAKSPWLQPEGCSTIGTCPWLQRGKCSEHKCPKKGGCPTVRAL